MKCGMFYTLRSPPDPSSCLDLSSANMTNESLQNLPSGHGNCKPCLDRWIRENPKTTPARRLATYPCPHCRKPFKEAELHHVFIDLGTNDDGSGQASGSRETYSEGVKKQAKYATEKINGMTTETPVGSVQRSAREVKKVADAIEEEGGDVVQVCLLLTLP